MSVGFIVRFILPHDGSKASYRKLWAWNRSEVMNKVKCIWYFSFSLLCYLFVRYPIIIFNVTIKA